MFETAEPKSHKPKATSRYSRSSSARSQVAFASDVNNLTTGIGSFAMPQAVMARVEKV